MKLRIVPLLVLVVLLMGCTTQMIDNACISDCKSEGYRKREYVFRGDGVVECWCWTSDGKPFEIWGGL
jgi:hypothetical protein